MDNKIIYVGTYNVPLTTGDGSVFIGNGKGIYSISFNETSGEFESILNCVESSNVSFINIIKSKSILIAVNELENGSSKISEYYLDNSGNLTFKREIDTSGSASCHVENFKDSEDGFVSNYLSGDLSNIYEGNVIQKIYHKGSSINSERQNNPHVHSSLLYNNENNLLVANLGNDTLTSYSINKLNNNLEESFVLNVEAGVGPRTLLKNEEFIYLTNELECTISVFVAEGESIKEIQKISVFENCNTQKGTTAELLLSLNREYLYTTTRGNNIISVFKIDKKLGTLKLIQNVSTLGENPRSFCITPNDKWLVVANQDSEELVCFEIKENGLLEYHSKFEIPTPVCIRMN